MMMTSNSVVETSRHVTQLHQSASMKIHSAEFSRLRGVTLFINLRNYYESDPVQQITITTLPHGAAWWCTSKLHSGYVTFWTQTAFWVRNALRHPANGRKRKVALKTRAVLYQMNVINSKPKLPQEMPCSSEQTGTQIEFRLFIWTKVV